MKKKEWARERLRGFGLEAFTACLLLLKDGGLTCRMVVKEFLCQHVAPLKFYRRGLWELDGADCRMRLRELPIADSTLDYATWVLFGLWQIHDLHGEIRPLYNRSRKTRRSILSAMPHFDCEGLIVGAIPREDGAGSGGHEVGPSREAGASEDATPRGDVAQTSAVAPTGPGLEGERHVMPDRRKRPSHPPPGDGDPAGPLPEAAPMEAPAAVTISAGSPQGRRADTSGASWAISARFAG